MINQITTSNFQKHRNSTYIFTEGVNGIVGSTDSGKSSLIRALRWCLFNTYYKKFMSWGAELTTVSVLMSNGITITRQRNKTVLNKYIITYPDGKSQEYNNFGDDVPVEITKAINFKLLDLDKDKIFNLNVRAQHDPHFLLTESGTTRAKALNSLVGVHIIDNTVRDIVLDNKKINNKISELNEFKEKIIKEIELYKNAPSKYDQLQNVKQLNEKYNKTISLKNKLDTFDKKFELFNERKRQLKTYDIDLLNQLDKLIQSYKTICLLYKKTSDFKTKLDSFNERKKQIKEYDPVILDTLQLKLNQYKNIINLIGKLDNIETKLNNISNIKQKQLLNNDNNRLELKQLLELLKQCPVCYSQIDNNKIEEILNKL